MKKPTQPQGRWKRKFTDDEVRLMRAAYQEYLRLKEEANKLSPKQLAAKFDIRTSSFYEIVNYVTYPEVQPLKEAVK